MSDPGSEEYLERILVKKKNKLVIVDLDEVLWIDSSGNYVELFLNGKSHLVRGTLKKLEEKLNPNQFVRVHKSSIVNFEKVKYIEPAYTGDFEVVLENDKKIKMSRRFKGVLNNFKIS